MTNESQIALDGDFKGHPFRGNQYKKASDHSRTAVRSSMSAKRAENNGNTKEAKKAHRSAYHSHMAAAESATGKAKHYHRKMAKFHGGRSGMTMDSVAEFEHAPAYSDGSGKWHSYTMEAMKRKSDAQLKYILKDATEAADAGEKMGNPKAAQYRDEAHYASMELARRRKGGKQIMDSVSLDAADFNGYAVGKIMKDGKQAGRAVISLGDGKAMVFLGDSDEDRVHYKADNGEMRKFLWSDDDAEDMVEALLTHPQAGAEPEEEGAPDDVAAAIEAIKNHEVSRLVSSSLFVMPLEGEEIVFTDELRARVEAALGEPLVETVIPGLEAQITLVPQSKAKQEDPTPEPSPEPNQSEEQIGDSNGRTESLSKTSSWVIRNKETGEVVLETFDKRVVDQLNTKKYEAVPILEHLAAINKSIKGEPNPDLTPEPLPEPAPMPDPKAEDRAFLMSVIDGSAPDILEPELAGKIEAAYTRNSADAEMVSLFTQAVNAYTQAMLNATAGV